MSATPLSKILRFVLIAAGLIIVLSVLWTFVDSDYSRFLGKVAAGLAPDEYRVDQRNGTIYFTQQYFIDNINGKPVQVTLPENYPARVSIVASAIQFGLLLAVALVAATPGLGWRRRLVYCLAAALVSFLLQLLSVVIVALTFNTVLFVIVSDLFPPLLWVIFTFRYWFKPARMETVPVAAENQVNQPGRKKR